MSTKQITVAIWLSIWLGAFLARPGVLSGIVPPFLLFFAWVAITGPTFKVSHRHPDIKRVANGNAMRGVLLRPFWAPPTLSGTGYILLVVALFIPGLAVALGINIVGGFAHFTITDTIWWILIAPAILCASALITESILQQIIAMPLVGAFIALVLILAPAGMGVGGEDPGTVTYWLPSLFLFIAVLWSLWLLDLLRALYPTSERRRLLAHR
jgi:hypothetical protein